MGFSFKTSWLAVQDRQPSQVADALALVRQEPLGWREGTARAYEHGVYVSAPITGWTLAHSALHLPPGGDVADARFPTWLTTLSRRLGEVQFFATHRVVEYHAWARARDGHLVRAYCYVGESGEVRLFLGEPTAVERELGVGTRHSPEDGSDEWTEDEWDAWLKTTPDELDVMRVAGAWSIDPYTIDDELVNDFGIYGVPAAGMI